MADAALMATELAMLDCIAELGRLDASVLLTCGLLVALLGLLDGSSAGAPPHADNNTERNKGSVVAASFFTCMYINKHLLKNYIGMFVRKRTELLE